jgi:hypothetical protein
VTCATQSDAPVRNTVGMSASSPQPVPTTSAPGGNVYVGPSLASSLFRFAAALATARPERAPQR